MQLRPTMLDHGGTMKRMRWLLAPCALVLLAPSLAGAQGLKSVPGTVFNDVKNTLGDVLAVWTSPFRGDGSDYLTAAMVVGAAGVAVPFDDNMGRWIRDNQSAFVLEVLDPFREKEKKPKLIDLGANQSLLEIGTGLYVLGLVLGSADVRDAGTGCMSAGWSNGIPRSFIYKGVSRERPLYQVVTPTDTTFRFGDPYDVSFPGDDDDWFDNSFFGGHGANVMSCASFMNHRFDLGLAEPVLWTVAAGVNLGRMADQRHWASDVVIGGVVGFAIGKYIAERQLERKAERTGRADNGEAPESSLQDEVLGGLWMTQQDGRTYVGWKRSF
jgi:membrane-associated phospholipid phosphatase